MYLPHSILPQHFSHEFKEILMYLEDSFFEPLFTSMLGKNHKLYSTILPLKMNQNTLASFVHLLSH